MGETPPPSRNTSCVLWPSRSSTAGPTTPASCQAKAAPSPRDGSRSSTSRAAISPSATRAGASGPRRTARSTTTTTCAPGCATEATSSAAAATRRSSPTSTRSSGPDLSDALRGMFAVAVWDQDRRRGVLIRDRLGIKPLYYAIVGDHVVFGSELKCVIASGLVDDELDPEAIAAYLTLGFVPGPLTPLRGVRKLGPGERLVVEGGRVRLERWWQLPRSESRASQAVGRRMERAAACPARASRSQMRLMSDVPLGAMLSGGLDSSLIVALMARMMDRARPDVRRGLRRRGLGAAGCPSGGSLLRR